MKRSENAVHGPVQKGFCAKNRSVEFNCSGTAGTRAYSEPHQVGTGYTGSIKSNRKFRYGSVSSEVSGSAEEIVWWCTARGTRCVIAVTAVSCSLAMIWHVLRVDALRNSDLRYMSPICIVNFKKITFCGTVHHTVPTGQNKFPQKKNKVS